MQLTKQELRLLLEALSSLHETNAEVSRLTLKIMGELARRTT